VLPERQRGKLFLSLAWRATAKLSLTRTLVAQKMLSMSFKRSAESAQPDATTLIASRVSQSSARDPDHKREWRRSRAPMLQSHGQERRSILKVDFIPTFFHMAARSFNSIQLLNPDVHVFRSELSLYQKSFIHLTCVRHSWFSLTGLYIVLVGALAGLSPSSPALQAQRLLALV
jgi:hypothetical protein